MVDMFSNIKVHCLHYVYTVKMFDWSNKTN